MRSLMRPPMGVAVESAEAVMAAHIRQTRRLVEASPELFDRG
ncbi:hypothetical protein [Brevibacterium oceani]|nr:hypothetical protein [Brevibacterium oceani]